MFMAFELLHLGGDDLRPQPLRVRLERLEGVLDRAPALMRSLRQLADDGLKAWQEVLDRGYEGLVLKDPEARYVAGRSLKWLKIKVPHYRVAESHLTGSLFRQILALSPIHPRGGAL